MITRKFKRFLSFLLVLTMVVSTVPMDAFAETYDHDSYEEESVDAVEESTVQQIQERMDALLEMFGIEEGMIEEEIADAINDADEETVKFAFEEIEALEEEGSALAEAEFQTLDHLETFSDLVTVFEALYTPALLAGGTVSVLDGQVSITDSANNISESNGTVTIQAKGSLFGQATNTVTITNTMESQAKLSFSYMAEYANSFTIAGESAGSEGVADFVLDAKESITIVLKSNKGFSNTTATLKLKDFELTITRENSDVSFSYDEEGGSVTVSGTKISDGYQQNIDFEAGAELSAAPNKGYSFLGWINEENKLLSSDSTYMLYPADDMKIMAVFAKDGGTPWFGLGTANKKSESLGLSNLDYYEVNTITHLYENLSTEAAGAAASLEKTMVLMNNAILSKGDYEIPSGVTLLIPFDKQNTLYTTEAKSFGSESKKPVEYRTLTMKNGANLIVNGALSLSGQHQYVYAYGAGSPGGNLSFLKMQHGSNVTVNNGGALYAYGYITGEGSVTANSGASVYEIFQIADYRGGSATTNITNGVFPISQYYIQNIEVPMTIYAGATEYAFTSLYIKMAMIEGIINSSVGFIAKNNAMFNLTDGYLVKSYDGTKDRLMIEVYGDVSMSAIKMNMGLSSINSSEYELPVNNNITVKIPSGMITIAQDLAMLPGSEIIIGENAKCVLAENCNVYVYDADQWGNYCGISNSKFVPVTYAPGRTYTRTEKDLVDAKVVINGDVDASAGAVYTTESGADISGTGTIKLKKGSETVTYQAIQSGSDFTYNEIQITSAKLKNSDGTYLETANYTLAEYNSKNGNWTVNCLHGKTETVVAKDATCTEDGHTEGVQCKDCGVWTTEPSVIKSNGHQWKDATCTEAKICTICGASEGEANGHNRGDQADCKEDAACTVCGEKLQPTESHQYNSKVVEATCTKDGYTIHTCSQCGHTYTDNIVAASGHNRGDQADCKEDAVCTVCGEPLPANEEHQYNSKVVEATCTKDGYTIHTCSQCGHTYTDNIVVASGHNRGDQAACNEEATCTVCGEKLPANKDHQYNINVVEPTCTEKGYTIYTCSQCGYTYKGDYEKALEHSYESVVTEPTCTEKGYTTHTCTRCGDTYVDTYVESNGHHYTSVVTEPTCTEAGYTTHTCACGDTYTDSEVPETGHDMTEATCTEDAYCKNEGCDYVLKDSATGHKLVYEEEYPVTCTEDGHTAGFYCTNEGCNYVTWEVIQHQGHQMVDVEAKNPTYTNVGWEAYKKCANCHYTEGYKEIAMLEKPKIDSYDEFVTNLVLLEELAYNYALENPGKDPLNLVIKYIRTGVERYNSGSWGIMAGYEDTGFAKYVNEKVDAFNAEVESEEDYLKITALKNLEQFTLPNGDTVDFGHMFGTMDITYHNSGSQNHADVGGWAGDLVDLLGASENYGVDQSASFETLVSEIRNNVLCKDVQESDKFSEQDMYGDLDAFYIMTVLSSKDYEQGMLTEIIKAYFTEDMGMKDRADYFLRKRLDGVSLRETVRDAVYNAYTGNKLIATLEGTREFETKDLTVLRKACCYAFADYICELAGDYVEAGENIYYEVYSSSEAKLASGVTQQIKYATSADNKPMVYYIATADITRDDVNVYVNYNNNDPASGWAMQRVLDQANAAQEKYGNPESEYYIENYNVIASTNASGYNMSTGEPGGLLLMNGVEYHPIGSNGFFGILKDGTPVIGTTKEYNTIYKDQVQEGVELFGCTLVKDGKVAVNRSETYYTDRASRTAVGITATGKVVMMVLDGRQDNFSCGGSMQEIAQIMLEAGCVEAVNLDGGGSTTYVAKQPGEEELKVVNRPSDGAARSVATSLMIVSTAPSSTAFSYATVKPSHNFMTVGSSVQLTATGVSATGDAAEIPEEAYWAVENEDLAEITEDGVLTAKGNGDIVANLMLDEEVIGSCTVEVVVPESLYFTKDSINVVYSQSVDLPLKALYGNKEVAIQASDVTFSCTSGMGSVSGFTFTAANSDLKAGKITATLNANDEVTASVMVAFYNQGEISFDFDQAVGGNRQLAWDRVVTNAATDDNMTYEVIDTDQEMVTSYTFAIDMSQIPLPEQLNDLLYMLPGADAPDASAWNFLLQLAQRISPLTEVKAVMTFDPDFDVDVSNMKLINEYFTLTNQEFDEESNALNLTLNWIAQGQAIDPDTANPLCIVSGIKLTPKKDADWGAKNTLSVCNGGEVSYKVYMRAGALYSFAQKEENQKTYGLYPYVNPNDAGDQGGYFGSIYCNFTDNYTLRNALKDGWVNEMGGFAYYENGQPLTGVQKIDGYYYDFGENGINVGQTKYTGLFYDTTDNVYRYSYLGTLGSGWNMINNEWYYFSYSSKAAAIGHKKVGDVYYDFEETGKLVSGVWANTLNGVRYYYGPSYHYSEWHEIDGEMYYFEKGYRLTGYQKVKSIGNKAIWKWYYFEENGIAREISDGLYNIDGKLYYFVDGINQVGLQKVDGDYYFFTYNGPAVCGESYYAWETHCDLPCSTYAFGSDGKMVNGLSEMNDGVYYYVNGKVVTDAAGLTKIGDDYYFISTKGRVATGNYYAWATNCDLPCGNYEFGADGKMLQGIVEKEDGTYFYVNGKVNGSNAGLTKIGEDYYFVASNGRCATGSYYAWATNCDLPCSTYEFGADGKMLRGIVEKEDGTYFYINGKLCSNPGLTKVGEDYYFVASNGRCATGSYYAWATNCDLPCSTYEFGADGKMLQGIIEKEEGIYLYVNGKPNGSNAGLTKIGDDYYFVASNGRCATGSYYAWATNCDLPCSTYEFGTDGKMLQGIVEREDGIYCYINGKLGGGVAGLNKIGDDYYFVSTSGKCATGSYYAWATNCDLPCGTYEFGDDGKMLNGFVTKDSSIYYYINGQLAPVGLNYIDGYYYFVTSKGTLVTNCTYYAWETNGLLLEKDYTFDELGRIIA